MNEIEKLKEKFGEEVTRQQIQEAVDSGLLEKWPSSITSNKKYRKARGVYNLDGDIQDEKSTFEADFHHEVFIPEKNKLYVKWGQYSDVEKIIASNMFCTVFITGLSGNGKTMMVEQACANTNRELVRVNITIETDEDDLFGGFRLVNGETKWFDGPVTKAMESGAILLLDEVDLASNRIMCLQPVLEGKPLYLKKVGRMVHPKAGFNIIATANTKGQGDNAGKFIGTNVLNEAFLERFSLTFEQPYPTKSQEGKIIDKLFKNFDIQDDEYKEHLLSFVDYTRKAYANESVSDIITTRRLTHIINAYSIFGDKQKALELCMNRFDDMTKEAFVEFYKKLVAGEPEQEEVKDEEEILDATGEITF
jgi:hypothetical protein